MTLYNAFRRVKQIGQACATADGHCCRTFCRSSNPNKQVAQGSNGSCGELAAVAEAFGVELDCERLSVDVEDFELSVKRSIKRFMFLYSFKNGIKQLPTICQSS